MGNVGSELSRELGRRLRALREQAGRSQYELGKRLGLSDAHAQSYLSRVEAGLKGDLSLDTVVRYVQACGGRVGEFLGRMEDEGVLPGVADAPGRAPSAARERTARKPAPKPKKKPEPPPDPREAVRETKRRNAQLERKVTSTLRAALYPVAQSWQDRLPGFGWVALANSAPFFVKAWKKAYARARYEDGIAALNAEFDAVVATGVKSGLPRAAMDEVRAIAEQMLTME